ncbi:MAG: endolytic transglycosylase MltG [Limnothrix sp.]
MTTNNPETTPTKQRQPRRRRARKFAWFFFLLLIVSGVSFWQAMTWWRWAVSPVAANSQVVQLQVPEGTPASQIGLDLESAGLIRSQKAWKLWSTWLRFSDTDGSFRAGTYQLDQGDSLPAIARTVWQGDVVQSSLTIPEGWSLQQMADYFAAQELFSAEEFLAAAQSIPTDKFGWLPAGIPHLEGFLYPDTYFVAADSPTPDDIITQMLQRFEDVALPLYQEATVPLDLTLNEWVTLGSIVEKEAVVAEERETIAGVFINRLQRGMRLETDPTVEYGLNIRQTKEQPLTFQQVKTPSPYNTYLNTGLPPTAIAAPGVESLRATLNPEDTEYLFFVAKYDGTHVFSKTLAEHEAATKKIRASITE